MKHDVKITIPESMDNLINKIADRIKSKDEVETNKRELVGNKVKTYGPAVISLVIGYSLGHRKGMIKVLKTPIEIIEGK